MQNDRSLWLGIIAAAVIICILPFVINLAIGVIAFLALMAAAGGASPKPDWLEPTILSVFVVVPVFLIGMSLIPVYFFWKSEQRWKRIFFYYLVLIIIVPFLAFSLLRMGQRDMENQVKGGIQDVANLQRTLYGKWETQYNGETIILEFKKGSTTNESDAFLSNGGALSFYKKGSSTSFEEGAFTTGDSRGNPGMFLKIESLSARGETLYMRQQGYITTLTQDRLVAEMQDFPPHPSQPGPVHTVVFVRVK